MALRRAGHDVLYVIEHRPGMPDVDVIALARAERRVVIADDKDFGELVVRRRAAAAGIVLIRIDPLEPEKRFRALINAIERFGERLERQVTVLRGGVVRVRMLDL
jgi:predicted nuclease of predicted toxin-antitoxin system